MYAQILVNQKTSHWCETFDYQVSPEIYPLIKSNNIVAVNFAGQKKLGLVYKLKKISQNLPVKLVSEIVYPGLELPLWQRQLAFHIARSSACSYPQAIFAIVPSLIKNTLLIVKDTQGAGFKKKYIIGNKKQRLEEYAQILAKKIIIFPELIEAKEYINKYEKKALFYHSGLNQSQKTAIFQKAITGAYQTIVGTYSAMFLAFQNHYLVMDSYLSSMYNRDTSPKYDVLETITKVAKLKEINLMLGDDSLPLQQMKHQSQWLKKLVFHLSICPTQDLINFKFRFNTLIYFPVSGSYRLAKCSDCQYILKCDKCQRILTNIQKATFICGFCLHKQPSVVCPVCSSSKIKLSIPGIKTIFQSIASQYGNTVICDQGLAVIPKKYSIIIGTNRIFSFSFDQFDVTCAYLPSYLFALAKFNQREIIFQILIKLINLSQGRLHLFISSNDHISMIRNLLSKNFPAQELSLRKKYRFLPYWNLWSLKGLNISDDKLNKIIYNLIKKSQIVFLGKSKSNHQTTILIKLPIREKLNYNEIYPLIAKKNSDEYLGN